MTPESPLRDQLAPVENGVFTRGVESLARDTDLITPAQLRRPYRKLAVQAREKKEPIPPLLDFRAEIAARRQLRPLVETFSSQIDSLLESRREERSNLNLSEQLAGWGAMLGLVISSEANLDQFTSYFAGVTRVHSDIAPRAVTKEKVHYGEVFTDLFLEKLATLEGISLEEQTEAVVDVLRSWRNLVLLPRTVINQALWNIPEPEKTLFNNIPLLFGKIQGSLSQRIVAMGAEAESPVGRALTIINNELERADSFFKNLANPDNLPPEKLAQSQEGWLNSRLRFPRSLRAAKVPLITLANEALEKSPGDPKELARLYQEISQNVINAFLMGRYGYQEETMMDLASLGIETKAPLLTPWLLLQIEKRGLCKISPETYRLLYDLTKNPKEVWSEFLKQQQILGFVDEEGAARLASVDNPYQIHQTILARPLPPPTAGKDTLFLGYPGKFWDPHLEHIMNATMSVYIARQVFRKDVLVLVSPNRRDPRYQNMQAAAPIERRESLFRVATAGVDQLLIDEAGQDDSINSNLEKFLPDQGFSLFFKRRFNLSTDPELGFIGGFEKAGFLLDLEKSATEVQKAILFIRVPDLIDMEKAIAKMRRELRRAGPGEIAIVFLPGFDVGISGRRVRKTLRSVTPDPGVLSTFFHPAELRLLATEERYKRMSESLLTAAGPTTL